MKFTTDRPYSDPEKAARRLMHHAHAFEVVQDGRIYIEKINAPFLYGRQGHTGRICGGPRLARLSSAGWNFMSGAFVIELGLNRPGIAGGSNS